MVDTSKVSRSSLTGTQCSCSSYSNNTCRLSPQCSNHGNACSTCPSVHGEYIKALIIPNPSTLYWRRNARNWKSSHAWKRKRNVRCTWEKGKLWTWIKVWLAWASLMYVSVLLDDVINNLIFHQFLYFFCTCALSWVYLGVVVLSFSDLATSP